MLGIIPNLVALATSLISMILLSRLIPKIGGSIGLVLRFLILGIFFSVFMHSGFELAKVYNLLSENTLMVCMGILLSLGSLFFIISGIIGIRSLGQR